MSDKLYEYYEESSGSLSVHDDTWGAQLFTVGTVGDNEKHIITKVTLNLFRFGGNLPGIITASIRSVVAGKPSGPDHCVGTTDGDTIIGSEWRDFLMLPAYELQTGTQYAIVVRALTADGANAIYWQVRVLTGSYAGGYMCDSGNAGGFWSKYLTYDLMFREYGPSLPANPLIGKPLISPDIIKKAIIR